MGVTTLGFPYPELTDQPDGPAQMQAMAEAIDAYLQAATVGDAYVHDQVTPAATWLITHNLGFNPNVTVVDSAQGIQFGEIIYTSVNSLELHFISAFGGKAYLS